MEQDYRHFQKIRSEMCLESDEKKSIHAKAFLSEIPLTVTLSL